MSTPQSPITTTTSSSSAFTLSESDIANLRTDPSKFQPKAWLSACWNQTATTATPQPQNNNITSTTNANISKIYLALQLQAQNCTTSLDDISNQVLSRMPRAIVEIERCDTEVANLRENLQKIGTSSSSENEKGSATTTSTDENNNQQLIPKKNEQIREQVEAATSKIKSMQIARQRLHHCKTVLF